MGTLNPTRVWELFEEICQIPRPSKKEEKILAYLLGFAEKHQLESRQDRLGNLVIRKPARPGYEDRASVVLQSHVDMVCEKNAGVDHDFDKDPILPRIDGDWVRATGTTLGADDGIGMAVQLAILESDQIEHGPIECLFTVDEETGLTGAFGLEKDFIDSPYLLNLDSEDDGELFIGCAGGLDTLITFPLERVQPKANHHAFRLQVKGLKGGHSGDDIHRGRGNAVKVLNRILWNVERMYEMRLAELEGGNLRNAIPREASAVFTVPVRHMHDVQAFVKELSAQIQTELKTNEPGLQISLTEAVQPETLMEYDLQLRLLHALYACPHGVMAMSADIPNLVETSTNLASVKMTPQEIIVATSQRSSSDTAIEDIAAMVSSVFQLAGARVKHGDGYPGWTPNMDSRILSVMKEAYVRLFGEEPRVLAIHAGLECGLIGEKYPGIDMISYGPTIKGAHSPDEGIEISTVQKFWDLTLEVLKHIPQKDA